MAIKHTKESIGEEMQRIQESVPACYREGVVVERPAFPEMTEVLERALNGNFPEEKKKLWLELLNDPSIRQTEFVEDEKKAKKLNQWMDKKIKESIKAGRLPSKAQLKKLNIMYENKKK